MFRSAVVVTGASGFVGGHVVAALLARGDRVVGIDRRPKPPHLGNGRSSGRYDGYGAYLHVVADLSATDTRVRALLRSAGAVLHLAGCPGVRDWAPDVGLRRRRDNVDGTAAVLAVVPASTPLLVTSSSSVYGGSRWGRPSKEGDELDPRGGYAESKVAVERLCERRLADGAAVIVARPFTLAGERQRADMALATWIAAARAGRPLRILGPPTRTREITDVRQAAEAIVALVRSGGRGPVNIGTGRSYSLAELADAVCSALQCDPPRVVVPAPVEEVRHTLADTTRLQALTGFVPSTGLAALVARQVAATPDPLDSVGSHAVAGPGALVEAAR